MTISTEPAGAGKANGATREPTSEKGVVLLLSARRAGNFLEVTTTEGQRIVSPEPGSPDFEIMSAWIDLATEIIADNWGETHVLDGEIVTENPEFDEFVRRVHARSGLPFPNTIDEAHQGRAAIEARLCRCVGPGPEAPRTPTEAVVVHAALPREPARCFHFGHQNPDAKLIQLWARVLKAANRRDLFLKILEVHRPKEGAPHIEYFDSTTEAAPGCHIFDELMRELHGEGPLTPTCPRLTNGLCPASSPVGLIRIGGYGERLASCGENEATPASFARL
jgi:hypothetical protein